MYGAVIDQVGINAVIMYGAVIDQVGINADPTL
jgi:hypothetical protein